MSGFLDTSVVVRYLTGDSPELSALAAGIIDGEDDLQITGVVLAETAYVLTSVYRIPRAVVVDHLMSFIQKENVLTSGWIRAWCSKRCCCAGRPDERRSLMRWSGRRPIRRAHEWSIPWTNGSLQMVWRLEDR